MGGIGVRRQRIAVKGGEGIEDLFLRKAPLDTLERCPALLLAEYGVPAVQVDRLGLDNPPAARVEIGA